MLIQYRLWTAVLALGLPVAAGCGTGAAAPVEGERQGYVIAITHGPDDAARVMLALATAERLPSGDNHVWFAIDGGQIAKNDTAAEVTSPLFVKQGTAAEMLDRLRARGIAFHI
jgi:predicted peroxiredoxin